jgi:hypothetical protein
MYSSVRISVEKQQLNKVAVIGVKPQVCSLPHSFTHHTHRLTSLHSFVNSFTHSLTHSLTHSHVLTSTEPCAQVFTQLFSGTQPHTHPNQSCPLPSIHALIRSPLEPLTRSCTPALSRPLTQASDNCHSHNASPIPSHTCNISSDYPSHSFTYLLSTYAHSVAHSLHHPCTKSICHSIPCSFADSSIQRAERSDNGTKLLSVLAVSLNCWIQTTVEQIFYMLDTDSVHQPTSSPFLKRPDSRTLIQVSCRRGTLFPSGSTFPRRNGPLRKYRMLKKTFKTLKEYTNLYRGHTQRFELS